MQASLGFAAALVATFASLNGANAATVEAVEARLFLAHTGQLSDALPEGATLWNTFIGEGDSREPSNSTLVVVLVNGKRSDDKAKQWVRLAVTNKRTRKTVVYAEQLGVFSVSGKQRVGFWLRGTGCDELALEASATGSTAKLRTVIPFRCGE